MIVKFLLDGPSLPLYPSVRQRKSPPPTRLTEARNGRTTVWRRQARRDGRLSRVPERARRPAGHGHGEDSGHEHAEHLLVQVVRLRENPALVRRFIKATKADVGGVGGHVVAADEV